MYAVVVYSDTAAAQEENDGCTPHASTWDHYSVGSHGPAILLHLLYTTICTTPVPYTPFLVRYAPITHQGLHCVSSASRTGVLARVHIPSPAPPERAHGTVWIPPGLRHLSTYPCVFTGIDCVAVLDGVQVRDGICRITPVCGNVLHWSLGRVHRSTVSGMGTLGCACCLHRDCFAGWGDVERHVHP